MLNMRKVLRDKNGFADVFILGAMAIIIMLAVGVSIVNFSQQTTLVAQTKNMTAAIQSRANEYAGALNSSLSSASLPSLAYEWDARTFLGTQIVIPANSDAVAGSKIIQVTASSESGTFSIVRSVTLHSLQATHVTSIDKAGNAVWVNSTEAGKFTLWSFATGSIRPLTLVEESASKDTGTNWLSSGTRVGIDSTKHLWAWGANESGQAGVGSTQTISEPTAVSPDRTFTTVAADDTSTFAIDSLGALWAWGDNTSAKLNTGAASSSPTRTQMNNKFRAIATSADSTFGIDSRGRLWAWGNNADGRLGTGATTGTLLQAAQVIPSATFQSVSTSGGSTYAIDTSQKLWAWGVNDTGQLGTGSTAAIVTTPTAVAGSILASSISAGGKSVVVIGVDGLLRSWGAAGRSGNASTSASTTPAPVGGSATFTLAVAGPKATYAISSTGKLFVWGDNAESEYGNGTTTASSSPVSVLQSTTFRDIQTPATGALASAVDNRGGLWVFGSAGNGLWPINFSNDPSVAFKMPTPKAFTASTWGAGK